MATQGLSTADQAAVVKAAQGGGLSAAQGGQMVDAANQGQTINVSQPNATPQASSSQASPVTPVASPNATPPAAPTTQPKVTPQQGDVAQTATETPQKQQLTMPTTGSVVDLLNAAGQDSSYAARTALAKQYGIQNYTGTAAQNTELSKKYMDMYNAQKGTPVPQNGAEASSAAQTYQQSLVNTPIDQGTPTQQFFDTYSSLDPVSKQVFDVMQQTLSEINTRTSLTDEISKLPEFQQRNDVKAELLNVKRIMDGTEDDIRAEITNAGGFATESQVQALTGARNKVLIKQANSLTDQFNVLNDYVNAVTDLTKADRAQTQQDLQTKLGIANTMYTMQQNMQNAAKDNYNNIIKNVGYDGLAQSLQGNPQQMAQVENLLGMAPGELKSLANYNSPAEQYQALQTQNLQLQNKKLQGEISSGPAVQTQVVDVGGKKVLINSKTGAVIANIDAGTSTNVEQLALQQGVISDTSSLLNDPNLGSAVGPNPLARVSFSNVFTGGKSNFIAGVQQLTNQLTLTNLQNAKANGATFGALSEGELSLLASSASRLNSWAVKDNAGNIVGYDTSEANFKAELDKINNFQKLDFLLKGGSPDSVNVKEMPDGTFWAENSDGTFSQLK